MNRTRLIHLVAATLLSSIAGVTFPQQALEIIPLRHRTVEQVLPALQPLLEPGAMLSGGRGQLFLRASPANSAEIKRALEAIDRPSKRLQISVRLDDSQERARREVGGRVIIGSGAGRVDATAQDSRASASERVDQRVQVLEGSRALIYTGQDLGTGFEVVPRSVGGGVSLDIYQERQTQRAVTTIATRLGEWTEIGGTASAAARDDRGIASASSSRASGERRIWLKVEELP